MDYPRPRSTERHAPAAAAARPASAAQPEPKRFEPAPQQRATTKRSKKPNMLKLAGIVLAGLLLAGLAFWLLSNQGNTSSYIDSKKYQAVFFTNGQVYFGKLSNLDANNMKLSDVFYIQAAQPTSTNPQETQAGKNENNMQLIKLGNEIHGPEDQMIISRDQVLFFENLKPDGKVTKGIDEYKKTKR